MNKKKEVFLFFQEKFSLLSEHHHHAAKWIKDRLKKEAHLNFYRTWDENIKSEMSPLNSSVYELIRTIEDVLNGHECERSSDNSSASNNVRPSTANRPRATPYEDADVIMLAKKVEGFFNFRQRERSADIKKIMTDAEAFIIKKQEDFAKARIEKRNDKIKEWSSSWGSDDRIDFAS